MMRLNDLKNENIIPDNGLYSSSKWYIAIVGQIQTILNMLHGSRYITYIPDPEKDLIQENYIKNVVDYSREKINALFILNNSSYEKMYEALESEYVPIWNYDGEDTITYTKENTGTQSNEASHTGTSNHATTQSGTINNAQTNTGTQSVTDRADSTTTHKNTTYDSAVENVTGVDVIETSGNNTRTDNLTSNNLRTDNLSGTDSRTDNLKDDALRTDNLKEVFTQKVVKHGNQGTTTTQSMIIEEIDLRKANNFTLIVANDIANAITY